MRYSGSSWLLISIILMASLVTFSMPSVYAEDYASLTVDSVPRVATIMVNDRIIPPQIQPYTIKLPRNTEVKVSVDSVSYAEDEGVRYIFYSWDDSSTSNPRTLKLVENTTYVIAIMKKQYRVTVISDIGFVNGSGWYDAGSMVKVWAKPVIEAGRGERYVFHSWSYGYRPFSPENEFTVQRPITVKAKYFHEYYVNISSNVNLSICCPGWYREGEVVTVWAKDYVLEDGVRLRFKRWISNTPVSFIRPGVSESIIEIVANKPVQLIAEYERECHVAVYDPYGGPMEEWVSCGSYIPLKAKPTVSLSEDVRMVFDSFIINGARRVKDPSALIKIDRSTTIQVIYKKEYLVRVTTPYGVKRYWVGENETFTLIPPRESVTYILANFNFKGWSGIPCEPGGRAVIRVDSPKYISAEYALEPDYVNISVICVTIIIIFLIERLSRKTVISLRERLTRKREQSK